MKALRIHGPLDMRIEEVPVPPLGRDQVLVRVAAVGICATDIELFDGRMPYIRQGLTRLPLTPGHEWSGVVEQVGAGVENLEIGEKVVGDISLGCGQCHSCLSGAYHLCERRTELGVIHEDGAFAQFLRTRARHVYRVPTGLSLEEAAFAEPAATCLNGLRRTRITPGDRAAVFGDGVIGFITAQMCRCMGAAQVILIAPTSDHQKVADELGITLLDSSRADALKEVPRILGGPPEVVSECSGNPEALNTAIHLTAPGGRMNVLSITGAPTVPADIDSLVTRDIVMVGSLASPNAFVPALRLLASGAIKVRPLISRTYPFEEAVEAFTFVRLRTQPRIKVLVSSLKEEHT
ncbi:MAG TPA: alcohol dehydrogenase catalytic domain-containing protein [Spirochaetia bacterium]|nr:alcohol dehydrogenase catalytic domain-containing protein [Spirochaetia bacterium]